MGTKGSAGRWKTWRWSQALLCLLVIFTTIATPHGGRASAQQVTEQVLATGSLLTWDTSWQNFMLGDREVLITRMSGQALLSYDIRLTPSAELSPEDALTSDDSDSILIASGEEPTGGVYSISGFATDGAREVLFRHAWITPDGQWTVLAQAIATPELLADHFAHIRATITLDGMGFWSWMDTEPYVDAAVAWASGGNAQTQSQTQAQEGVNQLTFQSGKVVRWESPWGGPQIDGNRQVYLGSPTASGMLISMDPASEVTPQEVMYPKSQFEEIMSGPDNSGGTYFMGGTRAIDMSGQETFWVVFRRTWTTPDGQWTVVTQFDGLLPNLENDLEAVKESISIDSVVVWHDVDPATLATHYYEWAGVSPQAQGGTQTGTQSQQASTSVDTQQEQWELLLQGGDAQASAAAGSYTSELFGTVIEWDDAWEPGQAGVNVYPEQGKESIRLLVVGEAEGGVTVLLREHVGEDVGDVIDHWASDASILEYEEEGTVVLLAESGERSGTVILLSPSSSIDPTPWVIVREVHHLDNGVMLEVYFNVPLETFVESYDAARAGINIDGDGVMAHFSADEIQAALP